MDEIKPGIWRHYKGNDYMVLGVAIHIETEEEFVIYRSLYGSYRLNIRPKQMFLELVGMPEYNYKGPRFKLIKAF